MIADKLPQGKAKTQVVQNGRYVCITWVACWRAYCAYSLLFGSSQSMTRLVERGGFGEQELDAFYPEWRNHIVE